MKFSVPAFFALSVALSPISLAFAFTAPNIDWQSRGNSLFGAYDDYMETLKKMSTVEPVGDNSGRPIFPTYNGLQSVKERAVGEGRFDPSAYSCGFLSGNNNGASLRTNVSSIDEGESVTTPSPAPLALFPDGPVPGNLEEITFSDTVPPNFTPETEEFIPTPLSLEPELTATNVNTAERSVNDKDSPLSDPFSWEEDVVATALLDTEGITERIMKRTLTEAQVTGAGGVSTWEAFLMNEENWSKLKAFQPFKSGSSGGTNAAPHFVTMDAVLANPLCVAKLRAQAIDRQPLDYDVLVCGGTLGIFFATALQLKGHRVCVLEAGKLRGREQEWNISMDELMELVKLGVLSEDDIDAAVKTEFPACRSGFKNQEVTPLYGGYFENKIGYECTTNDVLNLGVSPGVLLERVAKRFQQLGGVIRDETRLNGVLVSESAGTAADLGDDEDPITAQLVIDCMGNGSPISRQQRYGLKPDGVCAVVGCCAAGFDAETNLQGDIIYTMDPIQDKGANGKLQYFWEAFPVGIGRNSNGMAPGTSNVKTTYMFTYMDADEKRPKLETLMEDYWRMLPKYQPSITNPETDLDVKRVLFAYFPTYTDSPLKPQFSRVLPVGDASGIQSPLSFGGFGALTRHLDRISTAVDEAIVNGLLHKDYLGEINAYTPNLSAAWMFQKAMSVKIGQGVDGNFVNRLLAVNFEVMNTMGQRTIKPFLQDVIRFDGLVGSLARSFIADPMFMPQIVAHVGLPRLVDWLGHVSMMGAYDFLDSFATPIVKPFVDRMKDPGQRYMWRRRMDAWKFGSGNDYTLPKDN